MIIQKLKDYGIRGFLLLFIDLVKTKFFFPKARIIRFPIDFRGGKYIKYGSDFTCGVGCRIEAYPINIEKQDEFTIEFGDNVNMNDYVHIAGTMKVKIGNNVLIASKVYISDCNHGSYKGDENDTSPAIRPDLRKIYSEKVEIGNNVWIGEFVSILPGVNIGEGCVIGSNSVVTKSIPSYSIAVGSPARVIKKFNFQHQRWEYVG